MKLGTKLHFVFDSLPSPEGARFVEVETERGSSIDVGDWTQRAGGNADLAITALLPENEAALRRAILAATQAVLSEESNSSGTAHFEASQERRKDFWRVAPHTHLGSNDTCQRCGWDIRALVHVRAALPDA